MRGSETQLTLRNLHQLDEKVGVGFEKHLARAVADCVDRPADDKERKVTLTVACLPVIDDHGSCDHVRFALAMASKVPAHRTREFEGRANVKGHLMFNPESPEDADQMTLGLNEGEGQGDGNDG